ncbi:MAG TPA: ABC transporter permease [Segeticoccus sp.]|nr:ABC transporter permease [Segeticoccus sp.]
MSRILTEEPRPDPDADIEEIATSELAVDVTAGEYFRGYLARLRGGDTGLLPVIIGLVAIAIVFGSLSGAFLTPGNFANLLVQGAPYMLMAMAAVFVLLLGEVDLSLGFVAGVAAVTCAVLASKGWPWWAACLAALVVTTLIGLLQGVIVARVGVPSFVVTLAGFLGWQGVMLLVLGNGGTIPVNSQTIFNFANGLLAPWVGWLFYAIAAVAFVAVELTNWRRRRASGLASRPTPVVVLRILVVLVVGAIVVWLCNIDRGSVNPIEGVPWVVPIVLGVLLLWTFLMTRTRFGRYVYAVGGNAEAARRAGVKLAFVRTTIFGLAGLTTGMAGLMFLSRLNSISTSFDGGIYVLYAIAGAVIGGTSLFGGRGKIIHGVLGALVIAGIDNGMGLLSVSAASKYVVTALVLLAAVSIDAIARRGRAGHGLAA